MLEAVARRYVPATGRRRRPGQPVARPAQVPSVLCIEDHALLLASLKRAFVRDGWRVSTAADGEAALTVLRGERVGVDAEVDAVVADLKLPGITGLEVIKNMWSEGIDAAPVIYTAFPDEATEHEAAALGITFVSKLDVPNPQQLTGLVRGVVEQHRGRQIAKMDEVARILATAGTRLIGDRAPSGDWRTEVTASLARALAAPTTTFAVFLTIAEALRVVMDADASPRTAGTFLRLQAERCLRRSELAATIRLDQVAGRFERHGQLWKLVHTRAALGVVGSSAEVDDALRMMGWSHAEILQAVMLRRAVILVADTNEQTAQIGYELGVKHPASFNRFFKNLLGLSPRDLRELLRNR